MFMRFSMSIWVSTSRYNHVLAILIRGFSRYHKGYDMKVSWNRGTPSYHPFKMGFPWNKPSSYWGTSISGNHHIVERTRIHIQHHPRMVPSYSLGLPTFDFAQYHPAIWRLSTTTAWWFEIFFHIWGIIIPTDELIFFREVAQPPTR